jgi:hypothetical protein
MAALCVGTRLATIVVALGARSATRSTIASRAFALAERSHPTATSFVPIMRSTTSGGSVERAPSTSGARPSRPPHGATVYPEYPSCAGENGAPSTVEGPERTRPTNTISCFFSRAIRKRGTR